MKCTYNHSRCGNEALDGFTRCEQHQRSAREYNRVRKAVDPEYKARQVASQLKFKRELRLEALERYGGTECGCCHETRWEFLTFHHSLGDGGAHRAEIGSELPRLFKRLGWPEVPGLQVLCTNCHYAIEWYGYCPHQKEKTDDNDN